MDTVLVDTVGFIRNLPHRLIKAFKATLEEVRQADLLVQILDAADPEALAHYHTTMQVLAELEAGSKPMLVVLNKWDLVESDPALADRRGMLGLRFPDGIRISARNSSGLDTFLDAMAAKLNEHRPCHYVLIPYERGDIMAALHRGGQVLSQENRDGGIEVKAFLDERLLQYLPKQGLAVSTTPLH
jgi:GTP-binding protein HflX